MAAMYNKCRLPSADGTPCYALNADCPHTTIDTVLASLQFISATPPPGVPVQWDTDTKTTMDDSTRPTDAVLPVPLPPGFPAAPAEACTTIVVDGHEIEIVLRDIDEARLMARMGRFIQTWCEGDEDHGEDEDGESDMN